MEPLKLDNAQKADDAELDYVDSHTPLVQTYVINASSSAFSGLSKNEVPVQYKLYKRRWVGILALVLLNVVKGMNWVWFGAIANKVSEEFDITLGQVNWLGNVPHVSYLLFSWCVPPLVQRWGLRYSTIFGCGLLIISAWIRCSATARSLSSNGSFALMMIAQLFVGTVAPCLQVVGPRYAELWFDLNGRATATMIVAISDPLGTAVGQIISPFFVDLRFGILILAVITTVAAPLSWAVLPKPPLPPTYSGSLTSPPLKQTLRAIIGRSKPGEQFLTRTERLDAIILFIIFGVLVAGTSSFSVFISQIFTPHGYSNVTSGLLGGIFLLAGLVSAIISAPLFDRVLVHRLALTVKCAVPLLSGAWIFLIFAVRPNDLPSAYAALILISSISFILLPVGLELGVEITHSAETSAAILWSGANFVSFIWVIVMDALRAGEGANPPLNMRNALIFNTTFICVTSLTTIFFTGNQTRRKKDEEKAKESGKEGGLELSSP